MKPLAIGRAAARAVFHGGARMVAQSGKTQQLLMRAAVAPVAWKSKLSFRALAAVAEHHRGRPAFVETNLGIADGIRALIPVGKSDLIFGRPHDNLAERATLDLVSLLARHSGAFVDVGANEGLFTFLVATDPCRPVSTSVHFSSPTPNFFLALPRT